MMDSLKFSKRIYIFADADVIKRFKNNENVSSGLAILRIIYRSESGRLGLDSDANATELLKIFLNDALAWDCNKNCKRIFNEEKEINIDPHLFLTSLGIASTPTNIITYHKPNQSSFNEFTQKVSTAISRFPRESPLLLHEQLVDLAPLFNKIIVWNMLDMEPTIITEDFDIFINWFKNICDKMKIQITRVDSEKELPAW